MVYLWTLTNNHFLQTPIRNFRTQWTTELYGKSLTVCEVVIINLWTLALTCDTCYMYIDTCNPSDMLRSTFSVDICKAFVTMISLDYILWTHFAIIFLFHECRFILCCNYCKYCVPFLLQRMHWYKHYFYCLIQL